jgi:hypothetical protein
VETLFLTREESFFFSSATCDGIKQKTKIKIELKESETEWWSTYVLSVAKSKR